MTRNKVLLVEREPTLLVTFTHVLAHGGYRVYSARDEREAARLFKLINPGAVITCVGVPSSDGCHGTLIEELRDQDPALPIIAMSGAVDHETGARAMKLGASMFVAKPFSGRELIELLGDIFEGGMEAGGLEESN